MAKRDRNRFLDTASEERLCPFKKAVTKEYNPQTGRTELHERFEVCAGSRCMAYEERPLGAIECLRLRLKDPK